MFNLTDWFIDYVGKHTSITKEFDDKEVFDACEFDDEDFIHECAIEDTITKSRDELKLENQLIQIGLEQLVNKKQIDPLYAVRMIVNEVKAGKRIICPNCDKDSFQFNTGKYGDFIYCATCKCSASESTVKRKLHL